jgi:peptidoglycan-N-acetylglucosamine deacetylase
MGGLRASIRLVLIIVFGATASVMATANAPAPAWAEGCPGNPDALGTSRILVLEPGQYSRVGLMQYPQSLPLADKEVVLTFDDGPLPRYSTPILDILAAQCVKATYFLVGSMAREFPATVRRIHEAGHTIGTHTESHPSRMNKLPIDTVRAEIDQASPTSARRSGTIETLHPSSAFPASIARTRSRRSLRRDRWWSSAPIRWRTTGIGASARSTSPASP